MAERVHSEKRSLCTGVHDVIFCRANVTSLLWSVVTTQVASFSIGFGQSEVHLSGVVWSVCT